MYSVGVLGNFNLQHTLSKYFICFSVKKQQLNSTGHRILIHQKIILENHYVRPKAFDGLRIEVFSSVCPFQLLVDGYWDFSCVLLDTAIDLSLNCSDIPLIKTPVFIEFLSFLRILYLVSLNEFHRSVVLRHNGKTKDQNTSYLKGYLQLPYMWQDTFLLPIIFELSNILPDNVFDSVGWNYNCMWYDFNK